MRYFKINVTLEEKIEHASKEEDLLAKKLRAYSDEYCEKHEKSFNVCFTDFDENNNLTFIFSGEGDTDSLHKEIISLWEALDIKQDYISINEITLKQASRFIENRNGRYSSKTSHYLFNDIPRYSQFYENIISSANEKKLKDFAKKRHLNSLMDEADRIFSCPVGEFSGHPVHYIISPKRGTPIKTSDILVGALLSQNRLHSGRLIHYTCDGDFDEKNIITQIYKNSVSGTILITLKSPTNSGRYAHRDETDIQHICSLAVEYQNKVLTIFHIPKDDQKIVEKVRCCCNGKIAFVHICEEAADREKSVEYLMERAHENKITDTDALIEMLGTEEKLWYISDLDRIFDHFYSVHLRKNVYSSYSSIEVPKPPKNKAKGDASRELDEMIGLSEVKSIVKQSVSFFHMQELYKQRNIPLAMPARSMVFTGNPGTAKTTVARLIAQIFKDNNLLENGNLVEVGRADLVGKYVGWTAFQVKEAFEKARGSVLFIDEAYSLVDDRKGMFGDEAINTIVQEMENRRDDTVVIFAGYPDEMEQFLSRNPGLRSRIAFHLHFPDYTEEELMEILRLTVKNRSMTLSKGAEEAARRIITEASRTPDFGNGRFVRSLTERAVMHMSERLAESNCEVLSDSELVTLRSEDFRLPQLINGNNQKEKLRIGF